MTDHRFRDPVFSHDHPLVGPERVPNSPEALRGPVCLTGGTGFVGSHLVETLCAAGLRPRVLVRDAGRPRWIAGHPVEFVEGNLADEGALERLVEGGGTVLHLAGVLRGAGEKEFMEGNRDGTARLVAAVGRAAPGARLVVVSSQAAVGPGDARHGVGVDAPLEPISAYGRSKAAAEGAVRSSSLRWSILRPPAIFGPRDTDIFEFFRMASKGLLAAPSGERMLTIAHVADVVRAILAVATGGEVGGTYHVGSPEPMPMDEMLRRIAAAGDLRPRLLRISPWVFRVAGAGASGLRVLGFRRIPLSRDKAEEILARHWVLETRPSLERLGLDDLVPFDEGARMTWEWYRAAGWLAG